MNTFEGKRALVTGGGKGIGKDIAIRLRQLGAGVTVITRTASDLEALAKEHGIAGICADLSNSEETRNAAERAGAMDYLVNNAGISIPESFLETDYDHFEKTLRVNLGAALIVSQVVAKDLICRRAAGAIVNISSQASMVGLSHHAAYCASKGGLDQLTRVMALELGLHGIRANCVNPTVTLTSMAEQAWSDPVKRKSMLDKIPLGRFAKPSDVTDAVIYLLSDNASMITGAMLPVDGGFLAC